MEEIKKYLKSNWSANRNRIVLFADIMGFTKMVQANKHSDFLKQFRAFIDQLQSLIMPLQAGNHLRITVFSDTIVIGTDSSTIKNLNLIVKAAAILMHVCHEFKWAINGCIACGNLTFDIPIMTQQQIEKYRKKRIIPFNIPILLGDAVINSYIINTKMFCYGIVLHENTVPLLNASVHDGLIQPFYKVQVPFKENQSESLYYLNWIEVPTQTNNGKITLQDLIDRLEKMEIGQSERVKVYIHNTRNILKTL